MARPLRSWGLTLLAMIPLAILGLQTRFVMDLLSEMPRETDSGKSLTLVASKFDPGMMAPLTVVLESDSDLRSSEGLALIDDVSRLLSHQRRLTEVRSATQPLGSPEPLDRARLASRLGEVNHGFQQLSDGAKLLNKGLTEGAAKLRAALWLEQNTGLNLDRRRRPCTRAAARRHERPPFREAVAPERSSRRRRGGSARGVRRPAVDPGGTVALESLRPAAARLT